MTTDLLSHSELDPRCQPHAFINSDRHLYEVIENHHARSAFWIIAENVTTEYKHEFNAQEVCSTFELVRAAPAIPA